MRNVLDWLNAKLSDEKEVKVKFAELIVANGGTMEADGRKLSPQQCVTLAHMHGMYNGFIQAHMQNPMHVRAAHILLQEAIAGLQSSIEMYSEADLQKLHW